MPRFLGPAALMLYICLDRALYGAGAALYFGHGWEMTFVWLTALLFVAMVGLLLWQDRTQRTRMLAPYRLPGGGKRIFHLLTLGLFTVSLLAGLQNLERWWTAGWVDFSYKAVLLLVQAVFWLVAGRWWREALFSLPSLPFGRLLRKGRNR
ncbi:MAG: hypothetical protein SFU56_14070 [Capsulimonadales bacterium]|nr:hypothetical protein [Capsulimonadales bacterium]